MRVRETDFMKLKFKTLTALLVLGMIAASATATGEERNHLADGATILKEIEPNFTKSPIFLNPDESFKAENRRRLLEAIDHLEKGLPASRDRKNTLYLLGTAYSFAHDLYIPGAWTKSVGYLKEAIQIDPGYGPAHMVLGKNYMDARMYEESFREYEEANRATPNGFALRNMAFVRMAQKRTGEAQELLEEYVAHNPRDLDTKKIVSALKEGKFEIVEGK